MNLWRQTIIFTICFQHFWYKLFHNTRNNFFLIQFVLNMNLIKNAKKKMRQRDSLRAYHHYIHCSEFYRQFCRKFILMFEHKIQKGKYCSSYHILPLNYHSETWNLSIEVVSSIQYYSKLFTKDLSLKEASNQLIWIKLSN